MRPIIIFLLLFFSFTAAASEMQIFDLKHRTAEELIPIIQPMLEQDAAITGTGYTLIVRGSSANRAQIAQLLEQLDRAPQQLLILVEQDGGQESDRRGIGLSGDTRERRLQAEIYNNRQNKTNHASQQLRVLEGQWATIRTGQAVPRVVQQYHHSATGARIEQRIEYRNVESGFEVRPRINGSQVTLDIRPFHAQISNSSQVIEQQEIVSSVNGQLGQWIELGGASESGQQNDSGIAYANRESESRFHNVRLKVERIND